MRLTVAAPATVANLGPGFDTLALALDMANDFTVETGVEPAVRVHGEGAGKLPEDATNLVFRTMSYLAREAGGSLPSMALTCTNRIPLQRGLGSSASAVVAGGVLAGPPLGGGVAGGPRTIGRGHRRNPRPLVISLPVFFCKK